MSGFADTTAVPAEKTRAEIETTIKRYKADAFASGWDEGEAWVGFRANDRYVRFVIQLPDPKSKEFTHKVDRYRCSVKRPESQAAAAHDQAVRTIWRRLLLCIKAKLESVASGIETFETAFMAHIVIPDGRTVGEWIGPMLAGAAQAGTLPQALPAHQPEKPPPRVLPHPTLHTGTDDAP